MPTMTVFLGVCSLTDMVVSVEAISNVRVMSASVDGNGFADLYYITNEITEIDAQNYSCIHAADDEV